MTSIFYRDDNVLVTPEDQIPIVEIEDSYSSSLMQDFLWFTKVNKLDFFFFFEVIYMNIIKN